MRDEDKIIYIVEIEQETGRIKHVVFAFGSPLASSIDKLSSWIVLHLYNFWSNMSRPGAAKNLGF
jgi:hypothetical protein